MKTVKCSREMQLYFVDSYKDISIVQDIHLILIISNSFLNAV